MESSSELKTMLDGARAVDKLKSMEVDARYGLKKFLEGDEEAGTAAQEVLEKMGELAADIEHLIHARCEALKVVKKRVEVNNKISEDDQGVLLDPEMHFDTHPTQEYELSDEEEKTYY